MIAVMHWAGLVSAFGGPAPDTQASALPIPSRGAICGVLGSALGHETDSRGMMTLAREVDLALIVHDAGATFSDFQTADITKPKMARHQLRRDGRVFERGGAVDKSRLAQDRPYVSGFRGTVLIGGVDAEEVDEALRRPVFVPYLGRRSCPPARPLAAGVLDLPMSEAIESVATEGDMVWRLGEVGRLGADTIALPERTGELTWWSRSMPKQETAREASAAKSP